LANWVHRGFMPERTWLFDVPLQVARQRLSDGRAPDRFEQEQEAYCERTRAVYLQRVADETQRFMVIDGTQTIEQIAQSLQDDLHALVARWQGQG